MKSSIELFLSAPSLASKKDALRECVRDKSVHSLAGSEQLRVLLETLTNIAAGRSPDPSDRLVAVALLMRVWKVLKSERRNVRGLVSRALETRLPALDLLVDPDDRLAVAQALDLSQAPWISAYAASSMVSEEHQTKARDHLGIVLVSRQTLAEALGNLRDALRAIVFTTEVPGDSAGRRLRGILASLRRALQVVELEPGIEAGRALREMLEAPFHKVGYPASDDVKSSVSTEIMFLIHDVVRTQLSLIAEPMVYSSTSAVKRWFGPPQLWYRHVQHSNAGRLLLRDLSQAILLLGRQGLQPDGLIVELRALVGPDHAGIACTELATEHPDLPDDVRKWLASGGQQDDGRADRSASLAEAAWVAADETTAACALAAARLKAELDSAAIHLTESLSKEDSRRAAALERIIVAARGIVTQALHLADLRGLVVAGASGDLQLFSPHAHHLISEGNAAGKHVRIVRPMVERRRADGSLVVLVKALVELPPSV